MEIKVIKQEKDLLEFELVGQDSTYCNLLKDALWQDKDVEFAAFKVDHPLTSSPTVIVKTRKGSPNKAVLDAIESLKKRFSELEKEVLQGIKK
ncbi:DNA-directed RNA polymerase subunit L [Candidatus Woesearchaeota archaeon]|nr:DNA-directed RNA polymerase subunit L [Candidatus Woesearchaeota archaeon]